MCPPSVGLSSFLRVPDQAILEPVALQARPHHGGFPVPFVTALIDGRPDFKVHDEYKRIRVGVEKLCQLCGHPLEGDIAFIGSPRSVERRIFGEPPAHLLCLEYALEVCPFLAGRNWAEGWRGQAREAGMTVLEPPEPPEKMGVLVTDRFWLIRDDEEASAFKFEAAPATREIVWRRDRA